MIEIEVAGKRLRRRNKIEGRVKRAEGGKVNDKGEYGNRGERERGGISSRRSISHRKRKQTNRVGLPLVDVRSPQLHVVDESRG